MIHPDATQAWLNDVPLSYTTWAWSLYRGAAPVLVQIDEPASRYNEFAALPRIVTLRVKCAKPGNGGHDMVQIPGVRMHQCYTSGKRCIVVITDARADLWHWLNSADLNIRFEDGTLSDTQARRVRDGIRKVQRLSEIRASFDLPDSAPMLSQDMPTAGLSLAGAMQAVCDDAGVDITVHDGTVWIVGRKDNDLPPLPFVWIDGGAPGWETERRKSWQVPKEVVAAYTERHCLRVQNEENGDKSAAPPLHQRMECRNVFAAGDLVMTLPEVLRHFGQPAVDTAFVARNLMRRNWEAPMESNGSQDRIDCIAILQRDFRLLWQLITPQGQRGMWAGMVFGKPDLSQLTSDPDTGLLNYAGIVYAANCECEYTVVNTCLNPSGPGNATLIGSTASRSFLRGADGRLPKSPFIPQWINAETGLFRLRADPPDAHTRFYPGAFTEDVRVDWTQNSTAANAVPWLIEIVNEDQVGLRPTWDLHVFISAVRRTPQDHRRWHREKVKGRSDGQLERIELEVPAAPVAFRDYVDPLDPDRAPMPDGYGRVLNASELKSDAQRRAQERLDEIDRKNEGTAVAVGCAPLAQGLRVKGAISEIKLRVNEHIVLTEIEVGNLADARQRSRQAFDTVQSRAFEHAGKEVRL